MAISSFFSRRLPAGPVVRHKAVLRASRPTPGCHRVAQAVLLMTALPLQAQTTEAPLTQTVTVSGRNSANAASVAGFGDTPLAGSPFSATVINLGQLQEAGITGVGDLTRLDAGITDAYNAPGYWGQLAVRGFTLDPRFNTRRDGLPINAETVIPAGNKQAIEILKGTSGLQAGTSAPGGLVNLVVKRPRDHVASFSLGWTQENTFGMAADIGQRKGAFGWRLNAAAEHLDPTTHNSKGKRSMVALALEAQVASGSLLEAEFEWSRQRQPSTPGLSLLGNRLPEARQMDPRLNLNNQPWSLPVVMGGRTGSLRFTQALSPDTELVAHAMRQRLDSDDRIAFPYGLYDPVSYDCAPCDRYSSSGQFSIWDFRSDGERRTSDAADLRIQGRAITAGLAHQFSVGLMATRYQVRLPRQAYNLVGTGSIDGLARVPADPSLTDEQTNRDERSTEWHLQDAITLSPRWALWAGMRYSQLHRASVRTDGSRATRYGQGISTPWLALSHALTPSDQAYLSWGQGAESEVAPNRNRYTNAGQALPSLKSRQIELGLKHSEPALDWQLAAFDIRRPVWSDISVATPTQVLDCSDALPCARQADGTAHHAGLEAEIDRRLGAWNLRASALALRTRREGSIVAGLNGLRPTNVPARSIKAQAAYNVGALPGLALLGFISHEGQRLVLPDNSIATPGWTRLDLAARYAQRLHQHSLVWRFGVDNLADRRAWKEAPYQYGHAYLYPLAPRTFHASIQLSM